jgi:hypothetical protein
LLQQQPHHRLMAVRGSNVEARDPFLPGPHAVARVEWAGEQAWPIKPYGPWTACGVLDWRWDG